MWESGMTSAVCASSMYSCLCMKISSFLFVRIYMDNAAYINFYMCIHLYLLPCHLVTKQLTDT